MMADLERRRGLLGGMLQLAVPMHITRLRGLDDDTLCRIATDAATVVGVHGDQLQFGGRRCAETFNALARGLAVLALTAWGGAKFDGMHWCAAPACPGPDAPHPEHTLWRRGLDTRPTIDLALPEEAA